MIELQDMFWWMSLDGTYECKGVLRAKGIVKEFHHKGIETYNEAKNTIEREAYAFRRKTGVDTLIFDGTYEEHCNVQGYVIMPGRSHSWGKRTLRSFYEIALSASRVERPDKKYDDVKIELDYCLN